MIKKIKIYNLIYLSIFKKNLKKKNYIWNRSLKILPIMIGYTILIHNGNKYIPIYIHKNLIGYRIGEFAITNKIINKNYKIKKKIY
uniref:Ribosomal protein S19 n=1 Tax=Rhopalocnemis phalloides TaxID=1128106 RepID=A0A3Q8R1R8_9MAGN|nr:ribosomal protein S19 [Rhopalocnemis phalloides]